MASQTRLSGAMRKTTWMSDERMAYHGRTSAAPNRTPGMASASAVTTTDQRGTSPARAAPTITTTVPTTNAAPAGISHGTAPQSGPAIMAIDPASAVPPEPAGRCATIRYRPAESSTIATMRNGTAAMPSR